MTHPVEELRRQHASAESRLKSAKQAELDARLRLEQAFIAQTLQEWAVLGYTPGVNVLFQGDLHVYKGIVRAPGGKNPEPEIYKLKVNGKPYAKRTHVYYFGVGNVLDRIQLAS